MDRQFVARHACWSPQTQCWQYTDTYWEEGFIHDLEWEGDECYVRRVDMCLWIEVSCFDQGRDLALTLRTRSRERQRCYVLAERYCKETRYQVWTEASDLSSPLRQEWNREGEFWRDMN